MTATTATFGKMEVTDTTTGEAALAVTANGEMVAEIVKEVQDVGGTSFEYRASAYVVTFFSMENRDAGFPVSDYPTARKALAAAKAYTRQVMAEVAATEEALVAALPGPSPRTIAKGTKDAQAVMAAAVEATAYSLSNGFSGAPVDLGHVRHMLASNRHAKLRHDYRGRRGFFTVSVHSNLWYSLRTVGATA